MPDPRLKARCGVFYALRGKVNRHQQETQLPDAPWPRLLPSRPAFLVESAKATATCV